VLFRSVRTVSTSMLWASQEAEIPLRWILFLIIE